MGLFTDSMPIKSFVSLSGRGGNSSNNGTSMCILMGSNNSNSKSNAPPSSGSTNTTNNNGQSSSSSSLSFCSTSSGQQQQHQQQQQKHQQKKNYKAGTVSGNAAAGAAHNISTNTFINDNNHQHHQNHHLHHHHSHKGPSGVTSSKRNECAGNGRGCGGNGSSSMQQLSTSWEFIKLAERPIHDFGSCSDDKDEPQDLSPPRYIKISDGRISLGPPATRPLQTPPSSLSISATIQPPPTPLEYNKDQEVLEARIVELEEALCRLQEKVNNSQCNSPTLERDLKEQLENMNRAMKSKERKAMQACRDHKALQARFTRQENLLHIMQQENKSLQQRIRQYEHCLDDVMRKVVDAIVAEDSLREEVSMLKSRVRDLEAQNAALCTKGRDEGYCTMSTGQPQPSNSHLEDLPEEPEQWLLSGGSGSNLGGVIGSMIGIEPQSCTAGDMEDWSMSQEELGVITLDDDPNDREIDWIWNSNSYLNSTMIDSQSEGISQLLQETIVYSEDEEIACIDFTRDFYKLVNIPSGSTKSLYSHVDAETDDDDDDDVNDDDDDDDDGDKTSSDSERNCHNGHRSNRFHHNNYQNSNNRKGETSPTPSEAGQAQVASCSSTSSDTSTTDNTNKSFVTSSVEFIEKTKLTNRTGTLATTTTNETTAITTIPLGPTNEIAEIENNFGKNSCSIKNSPSTTSTNQTALPTTTATTKITTSTTSGIPTSASAVADKCPSWRRSNGWKRLGPPNRKQNFSELSLRHQQHLQYYPIKSTMTAHTTSVSASATTQSKIPPPVPVRRSYAS